MQLQKRSHTIGIILDMFGMVNPTKATRTGIITEMKKITRYCQFKEMKVPLYGFTKTTPL